MKLLPYNRISIQTPQPLSTVIAALESNIEAPRIRWPFSRDHAPYAGTLSVSGFEIRRISHYRNSFLPQIRGTFETIPAGTIVHITMRLHPLVTIFGLFWLTAWYGIAIPVSLASVFSDSAPDYFALLFLVMPLLVFSGFWWAFWHEANRSQRELTQIIQGDTL